MKHNNPTPLFKEKGFDDSKQRYKDILTRRYLSIHSGIFSWTLENSLPDVPEHFPEETLFYGRGLAVIPETSVGTVMCKINPVMLDIYGGPFSYLPSFDRGLATTVPNNVMIPSDLSVEYMQSEYPSLCFECSIFNTIEPYIDLMADTLSTLRQNINAMAQPIAIYGDIGNEVEGLLLSKDLTDGSLQIPVIKRNTVQAEVLDLKASDHTQNLINTFKALDCEVLSMLGVRNSGVEKTSGVNIAESTAIMQEINTSIGQQLKRRQEYCDLLYAKHNIDITCELTPEYTIYIETGEDASEVEGEEQTEESVSNE